MINEPKIEGAKRAYDACKIVDDPYDAMEALVGALIMTALSRFDMSDVDVDKFANTVAERIRLNYPIIALMHSYTKTPQ